MSAPNNPLPEPHTLNTSPLPTLMLSEAEPAMPIGTCLELDRALHKIDLQCRAKCAVIVSLHAHGHQVEIGLGLLESFVSIQRCEPTVGPRLITVADVPPDHDVRFLLSRGESLEIPARNLVPASTARAIFRQFFNTGVASTDVSWEAP